MQDHAEPTLRSDIAQKETMAMWLALVILVVVLVLLVHRKSSTITDDDDDDDAGSLV